MILGVNIGGGFTGCRKSPAQAELERGTLGSILHFEFAVSTRHFLSNSYSTTPPAVATFSDFFCPRMGIRTCASAIASSSGRTPSTSSEHHADREPWVPQTDPLSPPSPAFLQVIEQDGGRMQASPGAKALDPVASLTRR